MTEILDTLKCLVLKTNRSPLLNIYQEERKYLGKSISVVFSHITWIYTRRRGSKAVLGRKGIISADSVQNSTGQIPKQPHPVRFAFEVRVN